MTEPLSIPIACTLTPHDLEARKATTLDDLFQHIIQTKELATGYAFQFPSDEEIVSKLFDFIKFERQCCAFFQFDLSFAPGKGPVWLKLTGDEGVKEFIASQGFVATA